MSREAKGKGKLMSPFQTWDKKIAGFISHSYLDYFHVLIIFMASLAHTVPDGDLRESVCVQYSLIFNMRWWQYYYY